MLFHVNPIYSNDLLKHKLPNATINIYFTTVFALNLLLCRNKSLSACVKKSVHPLEDKVSQELHGNAIM